MRKHFYQNADGEILVFDLTKNETLKNIRDWYLDIKKHTKADIRGILLGNKSDLADLKKLDREEIFKLQDELNLTYVETSALTGENIDESFQKLAEILYKYSQDLTEKVP
jgi:small GTP-binding protein